MAETGNTIELEIITPDVAAFKDDVSSVLVRALDGDLGILPHHAPLIASLQVWPLQYKKDGETHVFFVAGGFLEVRDNKITVLTSAAEAPEQIDVERAQQAKERAEERLKKHPDDLDVYRAEMALNRAIRRIEVANQNKTKKS